MCLAVYRTRRSAHRGIGSAVQTGEVQTKPCKTDPVRRDSSLGVLSAPMHSLLKKWIKGHGLAEASTCRISQKCDAGALDHARLVTGAELLRKRSRQ